MFGQQEWLFCFAVGTQKFNARSHPDGKFSELRTYTFLPTTHVSVSYMIPFILKISVALILHLKWFVNGTVSFPRQLLTPSSATQILFIDFCDLHSPLCRLVSNANKYCLGKHGIWSWSKKIPRASVSGFISNESAQYTINYLKYSTLVLVLQRCTWNITDKVAVPITARYNRESIVIVIGIVREWA